MTTLIRFTKDAFFCLILCLCIAMLASCTTKQSNNEVVEESAENTSTLETENHSKKEKFILFFGNSLTAGYGLEDEEKAFPALIQKRMDSLNYDYQVINAGLSGETTAGGDGRIDWVLRQPIDIFVLALGANDMLRGFELSATEKNLRSIVDKVKNKYPNTQIIIAGMQAPPNLGEDYTTRFAKIFSDLATTYDAGLVPFLLEGVAANPALNQPDGIHPNAEGAKILMENVWVVLKEYL